MTHPAKHRNLSRAFVAIFAAILAALVVAHPASSAVVDGNSPVTFTLTGSSQRSPVININGASTCSVVITSAGTGFTLTPQATSDTQANVAANTASWNTATGISSGSITSTGTYTGSIAASGLTAFSVYSTTIGSANIVGSIYCSSAQIPGSGGGGSYPTPIPTLPPNADGGAPAHITNTSVPVAITTALPAGSANIGGVVLANNPCTSGTIVNYAVNISSAVTTQAIALSSGKSIYVCSLLLLANGTTNATLEYGTGSLCATGLTALTGPIPLAAQVGWVESSGLIPNYTTAASNAFCIVNSASVQLSGHILYVQQ